MTRRFGGGFANFSERHPLPLVAGERALERPNAGMHTNGSRSPATSYSNLSPGLIRKAFRIFSGMVVCPLLVTVNAASLCPYLIECHYLHSSPYLFQVARPGGGESLPILISLRQKALPARVLASKVLWKDGLCCETVSNAWDQHVMPER